MFTTRPLFVSIGTEVLDIDLSRPQTDQVLRALLTIFYESSVMVVRGQDLSLDQFHSLGTHFGQAKPHFLDHLPTARP